jgi:hypothetical protein
MTRRETLGLLCGVPLLGFAPLRALAKSRSVLVALQWDWNGPHGEPIDYFEVLVTSGDGAASPPIVTRVGADARGCKVSVPGDGCLYEARVRSGNATGNSALSAPITFRA